MVPPSDGQDKSREEDREDEARDQALVDNTAQGIFRSLDEMENKREIYEHRWIWELLQNAFDSAPAQGTVDVKIFLDASKLVFQHNGRDFKPNEVAHLIYHGSTKGEATVGKFGTGFLVTHLISRKVLVRGRRSDGKTFDFELNRSANSPEGIKEQSDKDWKSYKASLSASREYDFAAQYTYEFEEKSVRNMRHGIEALSEMAPYVLIFNRKIGRIEIERERDSKQGEKGERTTSVFRLEPEYPTATAFAKIVSEKLDEAPAKIHEILVIEKESVDSKKVEVALKLERQPDGTCTLTDISKLPKLFISFPLYATTNLPFPAIVNSRFFATEEKRDGIFLGREDTPKIRTNKMLLDLARTAFIDLLSGSNTSEWQNITTILSVEPPPKSEWLTDEDWYVGMLTRLVSDLLEQKVVKTSEGKMIQPNLALFASLEESMLDLLPRLWTLCSRLSRFKPLLPQREPSLDWFQVLSKWESLGLDLSERWITLEGVSELIEKSVDIKGLESLLVPGLPLIGFLNYYYDIVIRTGHQALFDRFNLIPNQKGAFGSRELFRDGGVDDTLKSIAQNAGKDVRSSLANKGLNQSVLNLLNVKTQTETLESVVTLVKELNSLAGKPLQANRDLLKWLLDHNLLAHLDGYPLQSEKPSNLIRLNEEEETPLAPTSFWHDSARRYSKLFPEESVVSLSYATTIPDRRYWEVLADRGMIRLDPVYVDEDNLSEEDIAEVALTDVILSESADHGTTKVRPVSKIAFLDTETSGIIDSVRGSKKAAREFLSFLFEHVLVTDVLWRTPVGIECKCGTPHTIYPSLWMARLRQRSWVPIRKDKSEKPSVQALAGLIKDDLVLTSKIRKAPASELLHSLGLSVSELVIRAVAKDEEARLKLDTNVGSLYDTFKNDPEQLAKVAKLAEQNVAIFIQELQNHIENQKQREINQIVGKDVEDLLKATLEQEGFIIAPTGVGSDFEIVITKGEQTIKIEVKSTVQNHVKMTLVQAKEAMNFPQNHVLAVVKHIDEAPTETEVRSSAKFVVDIGARVRSKVSEAIVLQANQDKATNSVDIAVEFQGTDMGIRVYETVWNSGLTLEDFLSFVRTRSSSVAAIPPTRPSTT